MSDTFEKDYALLEKKFKAQVETDRKSLNCDDIVFLPQLVRPTHRVSYVFLSMEPSLTRLYADPPNRRTVESQVDRGFRNFMPFRFLDAIIHYCAVNYLSGDYHGYYVTDISKGAMHPEKARDGRKKRWIDWFPLLKEELELVATKDATLFAVGKQVYNFLKLERPIKTSIGPVEVSKWVRNRFHTLEPILHHSPNTGGARSKFISQNRLQRDFENFELSEKDLIDFVRKLLSETHTELVWRETCLSNLENSKLSESLRKLAFIYKLRFEACRRI